MITPDRKFYYQHQMRKRRHLVAILSDIVDGCRKLRKEHKIKKEEDERAAVEMMEEKLKGLMGGGKKAVKAQKESEHGIAKKFRRKKAEVVYCRQMFSYTGKDMESMKVLDDPYGLHMRKKNKERAHEEDAEDVTAVDEPQKIVTELQAPRSLRWGAPAHYRYAQRIVSGYTDMGEIIHNRKRKEREEDDAKREMKQKLDSILGRNKPMITDEKEERRKQIEVAKNSLETETEAEKGERNLLDFIQRFHGAFFYKKEQLLFEGFQLLYINDVIPTLAPNIVGPVWSIIGPRICKQFGWGLKNFHDVMVAQAPRRFGKTICIAAIVINYALAKSPCEISIFSTGKRVSGFLQEKIRDILTQSGYSDWIYNIGGEFIYLKDPENSNDQLRKIGFYPSSTVISI